MEDPNEKLTMKSIAEILRDNPTKALINSSVLAWARERKGLTVEVVAEGADVVPEHLKSWEQGEDFPTIGQLRRLAEVYDLPLAAFYSSEPPTAVDLLHYRTAKDRLYEDTPRRGEYQLCILFEAALAAAERNADKGDWIGYGLQRWLEKDDEEWREWRKEMLARNSSRAIEEAGDRIWVMAMAMDDSGLLPKEGSDEDIC